MTKKTVEEFLYDVYAPLFKKEEEMTACIKVLKQQIPAITIRFLPRLIDSDRTRAARLLYD
jgi:hypothetical protein